MIIFLLMIMISINSAIAVVQSNIISDLDQLALKHGTDKSSKFHNYTPIYEFYFSKMRKEPINLLEIGFFMGQSAHMWEEYFQKANLHFIDIDENLFRKYGKNLSSRCHFYVANQSKKEDLSNFKEQVKIHFDIIIDDGGHRMDQQIESFKELFPLVKSGGIYIIEDLHTSYWDLYGGGGSKEIPKDGSNTTVFFLQQLIHELNFIGAKTECADQAKCPKALYDKLNVYQREIKSIHFYSSFCFILKN